MPLDGGASEESFEHDDVSSLRHEMDKLAQVKRQEMDWIGIPKGGEFAFKNDFSAITKHEGLYYYLGGIPEAREDELHPDEWDQSGSMASYSAGSEVAEYREFCRKRNRERRGPKTEEPELGPPPPPDYLCQPDRQLDLKRMDPKDYKELLRAVRDETDRYHRWGKGADEREYWKSSPIATRVKLLEGEMTADELDNEEDLGGFVPDAPNAKARKVKISHEMRRFTINSHPALARALSKLVAKGRKEEVRDLMEKAIPKIVAKFEKVTGRLVVGVSVHFDSDLPHWNIWHTGLERVIYHKGKGPDRTRYRRTAFNLNSSGPGLRTWRRSKQAFERIGKPWCVSTDHELQMAEKKAMKAQGRMPGDWALNDAADLALEELLDVAGHKGLVTQGYREFVENEEKRYAAGMAGKVSRMEKDKIAGEMRSLQLKLAQKEASYRVLEKEHSKLQTQFDELAAKSSKMAEIIHMFLELSGIKKLLKGASALAKELLQLHKNKEVEIPKDLLEQIEGDSVPPIDDNSPSID